MAPQNTLSINHLPAFQGLEQGALDALVEQSQLLRYKLGQRLCERDLIPSQVLVILEGQARLVGLEHGKPITVGKLSPGGFVGLASLLRAGGCEQVSAASDLVALAIPDEQVLNLYASQEGFRHWCNANTFPAEVWALAELFVKRSAQTQLSVQPLFAGMLAQCRLITTDAQRGALSPGEDLRVASYNIPGLTVGDSIEAGQPLPPSQPPLPPRYLAVPAGLVETLQPSRPGEGSFTEPNPTVNASDAPLPVASSSDLGRYAGPDKFKLVAGDGDLQECLACIQMLASSLNVPFRRDSLEKVVRDALRRDLKPSLQMFGGLASMMGLHASGVLVPNTMGGRLQTPALVPWKEGFAVLKRSSRDGLLLASPSEGWVQLPLDAVADAFPDGIPMLLVDRISSTPEQTFGLSWFLPVLKRYRGVLSQVLVASFVVQLFGLANPLLIQVIIDKVINQRSLDTLQILGAALVVVTILEGVLGSLRTFLFTETSNRIDTRLGAEVIDHLLRLPLGYFDRRPVGELSSRIAELEKIREFLTGQGLTAVLDAAFSVIYIVVMVAYSWLLTLIALAVLPIQIGLTVIGAPLFRRQTREVAQNNARTQSHLVEVLSGIQTVKAQNVEMVSRWKWQDLYNSYIGRTFEKSLTGTALGQSGQILQKLSQLLVLWVGASLVLKGEMSLGQLIAFRIISSYVTQPLLRLSNIWQNIQELKVSFERLADVIDTPEESNEKDKAKIPLPSIEGSVRFENLDFRFKPGTDLVLKNINLSISHGTFVGVVGQSGSGKSTLMKLLPRLYSPERGRILIDGYDIDKVELYSLRRQIGIVPQDPLLFSGSVSDNIALTDPESSSEAIVNAAQIACAHDFIMTLPSGYSSDVGERGSGLSGGQRQRIAIARTLLSNPQLLVMDEATSALDYDTERRVCENLRASLKGCTVFFITHRLSTIRNADVIVMMHEGAIAEQGTHDELMAQRGRYYALYRQQEAS